MTRTDAERVVTAMELLVKELARALTIPNDQERVRDIAYELEESVGSAHTYVVGRKPAATLRGQILAILSEDR